MSDFDLQAIRERVANIIDPREALDYLISIKKSFRVSVLPDCVLRAIEKDLFVYLKSERKHQLERDGRFPWNKKRPNPRNIESLRRLDIDQKSYARPEDVKRFLKRFFDYRVFRSTRMATEAHQEAGAKRKATGQKTLNKITGRAKKIGTTEQKKIAAKGAGVTVRTIFRWHLYKSK